MSLALTTNVFYYGSYPSKYYKRLVQIKPQIGTRTSDSSVVSYGHSIF